MRNGGTTVASNLLPGVRRLSPIQDSFAVYQRKTPQKEKILLFSLCEAFSEATFLLSDMSLKVLAG